MQTKEFSMALDMKRALPFRPFEVVEGDTGNVLHITLQNDGADMPLTGCGLCIVFASSAGFAIQDLSSGVSLAEGDGCIDVALNPSAYGAGSVSADIQVYSGENSETLITSTRFDFRCRRALISEDIIRANTAYPPLISATAEAIAATAAALAAAARIDTDLGELNVQADWDETDAQSDAYIQNKPAAFTPAAHAAAHAAGGSDVITPQSIGAMAQSAAPNAHAASHASGGSDAITPQSIGAAAPGLYAGSLTLPTSGYTDLSVAITVPGAVTDAGRVYELIPVWSAALATRQAEQAAWALVNNYAISVANTLTLTVDEAPETAVAFALKEVV